MNTSPQDPQGTDRQEPVQPEQAPTAEPAGPTPPAPHAPPAQVQPSQPAAHQGPPLAPVQHPSAPQPFAPVHHVAPAGPPPPPATWYGAPPSVHQAPPVHPADKGWSPAALVERPATASRSRRWVPLIGTAAAAALLASVGTAGLVHGFDSSTQGSPVSIASLGTTTSSSGVPVSGSTSDNPNWQAVAAAVRPSVVAIDVQMQGGAAKGSGVIADAAGHVITNNHVVAGATSDGITVTLSDGRIYHATVVGTDPTTDLAVLAITSAPKDLVPAVLADSAGVKVGAPVMAVGNPLGLESTVTTGIVSAVDRPVSTSEGNDRTVTNAIQIDAAINPGNSGGPLFDSSGKVIGITSSIASLSTGSTAGSIGLGFAIPSDLVNRTAAELIATGTAQHALLGVTLGDGTATVEGTTRLGAQIQTVTAGSPAAAAGLQGGDVVVAIGGNPVNGAESLTGFVREEAPGASDTLTVVRDGKALTFTVTFATLSRSTASAGSGQSGDSQNGSGQSGAPSLPFPWGQQG